MPIKKKRAGRPAWPNVQKKKIAICSAGRSVNDGPVVYSSSIWKQVYYVTTSQYCRKTSDGADKQNKDRNRRVGIPSRISFAPAYRCLEFYSFAPVVGRNFNNRISSSGTIYLTNSLRNQKFMKPNTCAQLKVQGPHNLTTLCLLPQSLFCSF